MADPERSDHPQASRRSAPETTAYGLFGFAGLVLGGTIGGFLFYAPALGALAGAAIGVVLAALYGRRKRRGGAGSSR